MGTVQCSGEFVQYSDDLAVQHYKILQLVMDGGGGDLASILHTMQLLLLTV